MKEFWIFVGVLVVWIALNRWVLPWFGIQTCMSGACSVGRCSSCATESWNQDDKTAQETKGSEQ